MKEAKFSKNISYKIICFCQKKNNELLINTSKLYNMSAHCQVLDTNGHAYVRVCRILQFLVRVSFPTYPYFPYFILSGSYHQLVMIAINF